MKMMNRRCNLEKNASTLVGLIALTIAFLVCGLELKLTSARLGMVFTIFCCAQILCRMFLILRRSMIVIELKKLDRSLQ